MVHSQLACTRHYCFLHSFGFLSKSCFGSHCSVYLLGGFTMSVGAVLCRCYALRLAVDGNGIIFVCLHPLRLPLRVRVCKQRPPSSLSHFCFFGRVAERAGTGLIAGALFQAVEMHSQFAYTRHTLLLPFVGFVPQSWFGNRGVGFVRCAWQ